MGQQALASLERTLALKKQTHVNQKEIYYKEPREIHETQLWEVQWPHGNH